MSLTYRRKIQKEGNAVPDELEQNVGQALYDLEQGSDLKQELKYLYIVSAKEVTVGPGKSAIVVVIPFRLLNNFRRIQTRLVHELEKKFAKNVVIIAQRRILQKPGRNNRVKRQKRPMSRTLTSVHNAMLDELVFPAEITGKRLRYKLDGSKQLKVYLDKKDQQAMEDKIDSFSAVYKKLTGKDTVFTFESQFRE
eukprot:CAMPEP_0206182560 /NCGR_PEP_ID=MMETSP0166-20121206/132_1 /ASSEMBLY_ACC=CAM_ASM_000260 /TAXON_ID=95228 /ORGANISM="Vannella robusta, Strain DIVA3 518/3/11/1/6" /LENGTH=194 /DNA_ID=CAMNT_0053597281 /DNA_START=44 /DNA_END=628 /DNA_ORIENTATION=+